MKINDNNGNGVFNAYSSITGKDKIFNNTNTYINTIIINFRNTLINYSKVFNLSTSNNNNLNTNNNIREKILSRTLNIENS